MGYKPISLKTYKKMDKSEGYATFIEELPKLTKFYFKEGFVNKEILQNLYERLSSYKYSAKFVKHACKVEDYNPFPEGFNFILVDFIQKFESKGDNNEDIQDVLEVYSKALDKMCKRKAKEISKELDMPKDVALELAVIYPGEVLTKNNAWIFTRELSRRLFNLQKLCNVDTEGENIKLNEFDFADEKVLKKIFKIFFGKDDETWERVLMTLLLEKASSTKNFNGPQKRLLECMNEWIIEKIEKQPIKVVRRMMDTYMKRRTKDNDKSARRIVLSNLSYEEAPKIVTCLNPDKYSFKDLDDDNDSKKKKKKKKKDKFDFDSYPF